MEPALILTDESAAEHGYAGPGPFTFPGGFPGVYRVGQPVALSELGFTGEDEAKEALEEAELPLALVQIEEGEGRAERFNHALSTAEQIEADALVEKTIEEVAGGSISTHAEADKVAGELGITFPETPRPTVAEKVAAIEEFRAAGPDAELGGGE